MISNVATPIKTLKLNYLMLHYFTRYFEYSVNVVHACVAQGSESLDVRICLYVAQKTS